MRVAFCISFLLCFGAAKSLKSQTNLHLWVKLVDKTGTPFSINSPEQYLGEKALLRRQNQNISIQQNDLPVTPSYVAAIQALDSVQVRNVSKWFNAVSVSLSDSTWVDSILQLPFVVSVDTVKRIAINPDLELKPVQKNGGHSNYFNGYYGSAFSQIAMHNGQFLHELGYKGAGIIIGVMDSGFDGANSVTAFEAMRSEGRLLGGRDFVNNSSVYGHSRHGTMVLSCMGADRHGEMVGTAPEASYWLFRTEDVSSEFLIEEDNWIAAAEYADSTGVDILNTSLGYTTFEDSTQNHTYADMDGNTTRIAIASDIAASKGMLVVTSAGNSGNRPWYYISTPADADSALAVGAVQLDSTRAPFSSYGPSADGDLKPNVSALGFRATVVLPSGEVTQANGTSFSSPILAGMAACLWQALPHLTNMELAALIQQNGHLHHSPNFEQGNGIPDFYRAYLNGSGIPPSTSEEVLNVYPVPFTDELNVFYHAAQGGSRTIQLLSSDGKLVLSKTIQVGEDQYVWTKFTQELNELSSGVYILRVLSSDVAIYQQQVVRL